MRDRESKKRENRGVIASGIILEFLDKFWKVLPYFSTDLCNCTLCDHEGKQTTTQKTPELDGLGA